MQRSGGDVKSPYAPFWRPRPEAVNNGHVVVFTDISSHQKGADLAAYAAAGHDRILLKATEGAGYVNPHFAAWWRLAGELGMARGAYHYARPSRSTGMAEADHFVRTILAVGFRPRDWVCLDVEDPDATGRRAAAHAVEFCARMVERGFTDGVIYSGTWYLQPSGLTAAMLPVGWRRLHIAAYNAIPDDRVPLPPGWGREQVAARQYTSAASQPGIPGGSDASRVVHEWLTTTALPILPKEDVVTEQDKIDIANRVLDALRAQVFDVQPPIRQSNAGQVIGAAYNKIGDLQSRMERLEKWLVTLTARDAEETEMTPPTLDDARRAVALATAADALILVALSMEIGEKLLALLTPRQAADA